MSKIFLKVKHLTVETSSQERWIIVRKFVGFARKFWFRDTFDIYIRFDTVLILSSYIFFIKVLTVHICILNKYTRNRKIVIVPLRTTFVRLYQHMSRSRSELVGGGMCRHWGINKSHKVICVHITIIYTEIEI